MKRKKDRLAGPEKQNLLSNNLAGALNPLLLDIAGSDFVAGVSQFAEATTKFLNSPQVKKIGKQVLVLAEAVRDPRSYYAMTRSFAEIHLEEELGLPKFIWKKIQPQIGIWRIEFSYTKDLEKILGPEKNSIAVDEKWTAWEAAKLASVANAAMSVENPHHAFLLGEFIGALVDLEQREKIRRSAEEAGKKAAEEEREKAKTQSKEWGAMGGGKKKGHRSPLKELIYRIYRKNSNITAQRILTELQRSSSDLIGEAIAENPPLPIDFQEVKRTGRWNEGTIGFRVNGEEKPPVEFKRVAKVLSELKTDSEIAPISE